MYVTYNNLFKLLIDKGLNKTEFAREVGISSNTLAKLSKNELVSLEVLVRICRKLGADVRPPSVLPPELQERQNLFVRMLHGVRFPLHDHCKRVLKWSNAQVLMRFMILQAFLTPLLFILFVKVR